MSGVVKSSTSIRSAGRVSGGRNGRGVAVTIEDFTAYAKSFVYELFLFGDAFWRA